MNDEIKTTKDIEFKIDNKPTVDFEINIPETYEEFKEFLDTFLDVFEVSFTIQEDKFKKIPSKFIRGIIQRGK